MPRQIRSASDDVESIIADRIIDVIDDADNTSYDVDNLTAEAMDVLNSDSYDDDDDDDEESESFETVAEKIQNSATTAISGKKVTARKTTSEQVGVTLPKPLYDTVVSAASRRGIADKGEPYTAGMYCRIVVAEHLGYDWRADLIRATRAPRSDLPESMRNMTPLDRAKVKREAEKMVLAQQAQLAATMMDLLARGMSQADIIKKLSQ